jgi:hypothetical protein
MRATHTQVVGTAAVRHVLGSWRKGMALAGTAGADQRHHVLSLALAQQRTNLLMFVRGETEGGGTLAAVSGTVQQFVLVCARY